MICIGEPPEREPVRRSAKGSRRMHNARKWVEDNPLEFEVFKQEARRAQRAMPDGTLFRPSPNYCIQVMRSRTMKSVPNAYSPYFARIAMEQEPDLKFNLRKSAADGWTTAEI